MLSGVTMIAPETVFLSHDTVIGQDALIEPNVVFGPGVTVEGGAVVHAFSHLEGAPCVGGCHGRSVCAVCVRVPIWARIPKVGNFCEVKKGEIGKGAKVNHLTLYR